MFIDIDERVKEKFLKSVPKIKDKRLQILFNDSDDALLSAESCFRCSPGLLFRESEAALKELFPVNFNGFKEFQQKKSTETYIDTISLLEEMIFIEYAPVDLKKWSFLDEYFTDKKQAFFTVGAAGFLVGKYHRDTKELIGKMEKYPLAVDVLLPALFEDKSDEAYAYLCETLKNVRLEDSFRFQIFTLFLGNRDLKTLDYFINFVLDHKLTRFKSLKEAMSAKAGYMLSFTEEEYLRILRAVVVNDYERYIDTDNGRDRLLCVDALIKYRTGELPALLQTWLNGNEDLRCTVFYALSRKEDVAFDLLKRSLLAVRSFRELAAFAASYRLREFVDSFGKEEYPLLFHTFLKLYDSMDKSVFHFKASDSFPVPSEITKEEMLSYLIAAAKKIDEAQSLQLLEERYDKMPVGGKAEFLKAFGEKTSFDAAERSLEFLKSDNWNALVVYDRLNHDLSYEQAVRVSDYLKSKKQSVKDKILKEYLKSSHCLEICQYLLSCKEEYKREIGEEMLKSKDAVKKEKLNKKEENGYFWTAEESVLVFKKPDPCFDVEYEAKPIVSIEKERVAFIFSELAKFIEENKNYEYQPYYASQAVTMGSCLFAMNEEDAFSAYPLGGELKKIFEKLTSHEILELNVLRQMLDSWSDPDEESYLKVHTDGAAVKEYRRLMKKYPLISHDYILLLSFAAIKELVEEDELAEYVLQLVLNGFRAKEFRVSHFADRLNDCEKDENIKKVFYAYEKQDEKGFGFSVGYPLAVKAYERSLLSDKYLEYFFVDNSDGAGVLTDRREDNKDYLFNTSFAYPRFREWFLTLISKYVGLELERGTLKTPYTDFVCSLNEIYGQDIFLKAIVKLRGLTLVRSSDGFFFGDKKNDVISKILKICRPKETETYADFEEAVKKYEVTKEELIRAAVYNLNFLDRCAAFLKIPGFKSAVLYFAAHLNETLSDEKIEKIREYSTIDHLDFKDGAFDFAWYKEMTAAISPADFKRIYENAKYITVAGLHKRAQRFFDALHGKISIQEAKEKILTTRNKDYCLIYSLIPLRDEKDQQERYLFFTEFLRESKKYGAQRQLSERRTVDIAFENLARNAGYEDTDLFIYEMESKDLRVIQMYEEGVSAEGYTLKLVLSEGKVKVQIAGQNGKLIQKLPASLAKNQAAEEILACRKSEESKRIRLKKLLEQSMEEQKEFSFEQICTITRQPLIRSFFEKLILTDGRSASVFREGSILDLQTKSLAQGGKFTIAHPVTLQKTGMLREAMKYVIANDIRQPFKQVFREMYLLSEGERNAEEVLRFKGFNVNLKRAVAALKNRGWGVSEDIGLRKVYYCQNTVAAVFREFDYYYIYDFDNEDRELESVLFLERKSADILPLAKIDPIVFSETLRDVDLMVSVSVNNVYDYELSMSTIEMRRAMVESIVGILGLQNISFLKENVKVEGTYGTYIVNIRTGLVFKEGRGNLLLKTIDNYDKPLALDFIDEDPVTADIVTKLLVLSNDAAIRDGNILDEIRK